MIAYQLCATGFLKHFDGGHRYHSRKIFLNKDNAEKHISEFIKLITDSQDDTKSLMDLDLDKLNIKILELEIADYID